MDTKNPVSNTNIVETDKAGGTDVKTPEERAEDARIIDGVTKDTSAPIQTDGTVKPLPKLTQTPALPTVKVRLLGGHTHEGVTFDEGDIIDVDEQSATYITEVSKTGVRV